MIASSLSIRGLLQRNPSFFRNAIRNSSNIEHEQRTQTYFGFQPMGEDEKTEKVHKVFEDMAKKYDLIGDIVSVGIQRIWKDIFIHRLSPTKGTKLLDAAGGTGDITFRFLEYARNAGILHDCHVTVCDINPAMLDVGKLKGNRWHYNEAMISWQVEDAEKLLFDDNTFNAYTVAFGVRNVTRIDKVLNEAYRILQPGGRFLCLEFGQLENATAQRLFDLYSFKIIPVIGHLIQGNWQHYQYFAESIKQFPNQETFKNMIEEAGFRQVSYENLALGVVAIHSGFKI